MINILGGYFAIKRAQQKVLELETQYLEIELEMIKIENKNRFFFVGFL